LLPKHCFLTRERYDGEFRDVRDDKNIACLINLAIVLTLTPDRYDLFVAEYLCDVFRRSAVPNTTSFPSLTIFEQNERLLVHFYFKLWMDSLKRCMDRKQLTPADVTHLKLVMSQVQRI
jgi:hypothetical protein